MSRYDIPDPICEHRGNAFMSWPSILDPGFTDAAHASTYVCARTKCVDDAREWVRARTGHDGILTTFAEQRAARARDIAPKEAMLW